MLEKSLQYLHAGANKSLLLLDSTGKSYLPATVYNVARGSAMWTMQSAESLRWSILRGIVKCGEGAGYAYAHYELLVAHVTQRVDDWRTKSMSAAKALASYVYSSYQSIASSCSQGLAKLGFKKKHD